MTNTALAQFAAEVDRLVKEAHGVPQPAMLRQGCPNLAPLVINGAVGFAVTCTRERDHPEETCVLVVEWTRDTLTVRGEVTS